MQEKPDERPKTTRTEPQTHFAAPPTNPIIHQSSIPGPASRRRRSKVARLPHRLRELVNLMLHDGAPYADIIKALDGHGYSLNADNLSRWHAGGYQHWLREQSLLDDQQARLDFATQVVNKEQGYLIQEASLRIAILRMYNLLLDFDPAVLKTRIAENPGAYARILNALCKLSSGAVGLERFRLEQDGD